MPTTPKGIVYPDSSGHTRLWEHLQALAETADAAVEEATPGGLSSYRSTSAASIPDSTFTTVGSWTVAADAGYGSFNTSNGTLTVSAAGVYMVRGQFAWASSVAGRRIALLRVNGVEEARSDHGSGGFATSTLTTMVSLAAGNSIVFNVYQSSGSGLALQSTVSHQINVVRLGG